MYIYCIYIYCIYMYIYIYIYRYACMYVCMSLYYIYTCTPILTSLLRRTLTPTGHLFYYIGDTGEPTIPNPTC